MKRLLKNQILKDLDKKMVFLVGPRQVGKTWLSKEVAKEFSKSLYLNYDNPDDKEVIMNKNWFPNIELIIFDEIHKMEKWKNYIKGVYDTKPLNQKILVTGSARLDTFRKSGDALSGRFYSLRLLPVTYKEMQEVGENKELEEFTYSSGFPEPFLSHDKVEIDRWRNQYIDGLIRNDILDFENIRDLKAMNLLMEMLRNRVGSPLSFKSIAEDIGTSPVTIMKYVEILESLFIIFKVHPFSKKISRSIKKEPKIYFYDTGMVKGNIGLRVENLVAVSLLKDTYGKHDILGKNIHLNYIRDREKREIDFCISEDDSLVKLYEVKNSDDQPTKALRYFSKKYNIPAAQIVFNLKNEHINSGIEILDGLNFLRGLQF